MAPDQNTQTTDATAHGFYAPMTQAPQPMPAPIQPAPVQAQPQDNKGQYRPYEQQNTVPQQYGYAQPPVGYQPVYQPYQPQLEYKKSWELTKDVLQGLSVVSCIVGLGLSLSLIGTRWELLALATNLPIFIFALIWGIAALATRWRRKFKDFGVHPGAHVAFSLLIWLAASLLGGIQVTYVAVMSDWDYDYDVSWECRNMPLEDSGPCARQRRGRRDEVAALAAFTVVLFVIHFVLFIGACIDTAKFNSAARARVMVVQAPPPNWAPMPQQWQPMPPHPAHGGNIPMQTRSDPSQMSPQPTTQTSPAPPQVTEFYSPRGPTQTQSPPPAQVTEFYSPQR